SPWYERPLDCLGTSMIIGKPAPFVNAFIDAVDETIRAHSAPHGMSALQRAWLAFCVTAVLVTNSVCWARFERASLGTYSLAALSWISRSRSLTELIDFMRCGRFVPCVVQSQGVTDQQVMGLDTVYLLDLVFTYL